MKVSFLHKMFCVRSEYHFGVEALFFADFQSKNLLSEIGLWKFLGEELPGVAIDEAIPKSRAEFLVRGNAYTPGSVPSPTCPVRAKVGEVEKSLYTIGDRYWQDGTFTEPTPFTSMPITWERAYGGNGYADNPIGRGHAPIPLGDDRFYHPLPNVETPGKLIDSTSAQPDPASFMPVGFTWPSRVSKAGTYDEAWIKTRFPGYPDDIDWTIFNAAPPDQWSVPPWAPDTSFEFENMHPTKPIAKGTLPGYVARAFLVFGKSTKERQRWEEVPLRLNTLWFFPHAEKVLLGFSGALKVQEDDGSDVDWVVLGAEHAGRPKSIEHYQNVMSERQGFEPEAIAASFRDSDLLPEGMPSDTAEVVEHSDALTPEQLLRRNRMRGAIEDWEEARQKCVAAGVDPDEYLGPCPFSESDTEPTEELGIEAAITMALSQKARAEDEQRKAEDIRQATDTKMQALANEAGMALDAEMASARENLPQGAPIQWASKILEEQQLLASSMRERGWPQEDLEAQLADPHHLTGLEQLEEMQVAAYRTAAHSEESTAGIPDPSFLGRLRAWAEEKLSSDKGFRGLDMTGADLSGLDLSGADFEGAFLEHANLENTRCEGTNFSECVLVRTRWSGAELNQTNMEGANLGRAKLGGAKIQGPVNFANSLLDHSELTGLSFSRCRLDGVTFSEMALERTDFSNAEMSDVTFRECTLNNNDFHRATLHKATFDECEINNTSFAHATMTQASFNGSRVKNTSFTGIQAENLRVTQETSMPNCDFSESNLRSSTMRQTNLHQARFDGAQLDHADLSGCVLEGASFRGARGRHLRLTRAQLQKANLDHADLMFSTLDKAHIPGTTLRGANLFSADLGLVQSDGETDVQGANTKRVKYHPQRSSDS